MAKGKGGLISLGGCGDRVREREREWDGCRGREGRRVSTVDK